MSSLGHENVDEPRQSAGGARVSIAENTCHVCLRFVLTTMVAVVPGLVSDRPTR